MTPSRASIRERGLPTGGASSSPVRRIFLAWVFFVGVLAIGGGSVYAQTVVAPPPVGEPSTMVGASSAADTMDSSMGVMGSPPRRAQEANPANVGPALPTTMTEEEANHRYGVERIAREARKATRVGSSARTRKPRRLGDRFHGPVIEVEKTVRQRVITATGVTEFNEDRLFDTIVTQSGLVSSLYVFPGQFLSKGRPIMSIFSPERVNVQHMLLADFSKDLGNQLSLQYYSSFSSSEAYLEGARSNMRWWGFTDEQIDHLLKTQEIEYDYVVTADDQGFIINTLQRPGGLVVAGDRGDQSFVLAGDTILNQADLRSVWGMSFVNTSDYPYFRVGQVVDVTVGEGDDQWDTTGVIVHKHEFASDQTRRADFHVLLENEDNLLRPGSFIKVRTKVGVAGLWIPESAALHVNGGTCVIREDSDGFALQPITTDVKVRGYWHVVEGLLAGDRIVASPRSELDPDTHRTWLADWY